MADSAVEDGVLHPRPQLTREHWSDLTGTWGFAYDDDDVGLAQRWYDRSEPFDREIVVPFPPESAASGIGDVGFHPVVWYRRTFGADHSPGRCLLLHFGAVDYRCSVWVNGQLVATHEGGHTPFTADITHLVTAEGPQVLVVRAEDCPEDTEQPRGKQDWQELPHSVWYHRTTGIWQPVWMEEVPAERIESVRWTPHVDRSIMGVQVRVRAAGGDSVRLRIRLSLHGDVVVDDVCRLVGAEIVRELALPIRDPSVSGRRRVQWAPEHPNLLEATLTLLDQDRVVDEVGSYTAMRSVEVRQDLFHLNGMPYFLRLVLAQGFWPQSHLAAPKADSLRAEVALAKELGFNGVRVHQKVEDPRFLYWCDRLGLLVWAEMPAAFGFSRRSVERLTREWLEVLDRDYSHPCIVAWVPVNESWGVPQVGQSPAQQDFVRSLYHLTKAQDPTRPAIGNDGWEQVVSDILTVHDYSSQGETLTERYGSEEALERTLQRIRPGHRTVILEDYRRGREPVVISEFGGITLSPDSGGAWAGYGVVQSPRELLQRYRALVEALLDSTAIAGFCYTQLTDTLQERNGLATEDRVPKLDAAAIRAITRRTAASVPADAIYAFQDGDYPPASLDMHQIDDEPDSDSGA